ncbi:unnamed protein product [Pseudo-nitzschia multistriata]|uniref:Uncharacterized protein n=1 Tax=Pseudo-nitzschia multistriata TaxID=183589 RepID=A0A448YX38_9STRA|nr:unnamed protein product [Pseudo-nitzschia multistriata]
MCFPMTFSKSSKLRSSARTSAPPSPPPGLARVSAIVISPFVALSILDARASFILPAPPAMTASSLNIPNAAMMLTIVKI